MHPDDSRLLNEHTRADPWRRHPGHHGAILLGLLVFAIPALAQITLDAQVVAGGGGTSTSAGGCIGLNATLGESVAGVASGGGFSVAAGYWARVQPGSRDSLFNSGFEGCQ